MTSKSSRKRKRAIAHAHAQASNVNAQPNVNLHPAQSVNQAEDTGEVWRLESNEEFLGRQLAAVLARVIVLQAQCDAQASHIQAVDHHLAEALHELEHDRENIARPLHEARKQVNEVREEYGNMVDIVSSLSGDRSREINVSTRTKNVHSRDEEDEDGNQGSKFEGSAQASKRVKKC